ncbi:MAG: T9SS type A sorting domain-containing protein [Ignavibacteria bacterium]|nr:T9SS type A sorting domain-containing protein [Ignavibacteria bacterium]
MKKPLVVLFMLALITGYSYSQWVEQVSGTSLQLSSISAPDDNNVWICGNAGLVKKTVNGGTNWTTTTAPAAEDLYNIWAIDGNVALTTSSPAATNVYRTSNGGANWSLVFTQAGGFMDAIWMTSATNGFMMGDPVGGRWSLWRTTNGGVNWDSTGLYVPQIAAEASWNNSLYISGSNIYFGTNTNRIYYSSNNGANWTSQTTPAASQYAVWFNTPTVGLSGGANMFSTVNGGTTWSNMTSLGTSNISGITGIGTTWYFVRQANLIFKSTNNGTTWAIDYTATVGAQYLHIGKSRTGTRMWACTITGGISKSEGAVGIAPISNEVPSAFGLEQNYPNPFNPSTTFKFNVPSASNVSLKIYDMLGNEITTLVNENLQSGVYEVKFDASTLSSGVYFYSLNAGNFTATKKMMLVK